MDSDCYNSGDGDLYGLGVRLGLYFQWSAGFLLRTFDSSWKTLSAVRVVNNCISLAVVLSAMVNTTRGLALATDFLIVYYLAIALFYNESYNLLRKTTADRKISYELQPDIPLMFQNVIFATASLYGGWFWTSGIAKAPQTVCGAKAAVIGSFDLNNQRWKAFAAAFSIAAGIIFSIIFSVHLIHYYSWGNIARLRPILKVLDKGRRFSGGFRERGQIISFGPSHHFLRPKLRPSSALHFFILNLAGPLIAISSVEVMIKQNHLVTAGIFESTGQMMALMSGITCFVMSTWELGLVKLWGKPKEQGDTVSRLIYNEAGPLHLADLKTASEELNKAVEEFSAREELSDGQRVPRRSIDPTEPLRRPN